MNFDFGEVLSRSWKITWKNKVLWLYGGVLTLASFMLIPLIVLPAFAPLADERLVEEPFFLLVFFGGLLLFFLALYPISALLNVALTLGVLRAERGEEKLPFTEIIRESFPLFWRYLGTMILFVGGMFLVMFAFFIVLMVASVATFGLAIFCWIPFSVLQYPLMLVWYGCMEQALSAVVTDNISVMDSAKLSWQLFKKNVWVFIVIGLVMYFGTYMISSVVMMPFMFPFFLLPIAFESAEFGRIALVLTGLFALLFVPIFSIFQGAVLTFMRSGWVLTYMRLTKPQSNAPMVAEANA